MDEMPMFRLSLRLRVELWAHDRPAAVVALYAFALLLVWTS